MENQEILKNLGKLAKTLNSQRVISEGEIQEVLTAIIAILAENKKGVESLNQETKKQLEQAFNYLEKEHASVIKAIEKDLTKTKSEIEKATKAQNERAFKRLQTLIAEIKMPKDGKDGVDGKDGKDGRDGMDAKVDEESIVQQVLSRIKFPEFKTKTKELIVGGIRFLENLADVSIPITDKRQDMMIQYNTTNNRFESGVALTVSSTEPTNPKVNDLWVDIS